MPQNELFYLFQNKVKFDNFTRTMNVNEVIVLRYCSTHQPCIPFSEASRNLCWTNRETFGGLPLGFLLPFLSLSSSVLSKSSLSTPPSSSGLREASDWRESKTI